MINKRFYGLLLVCMFILGGCADRSQDRSVATDNAAMKKSKENLLYDAVYVINLDRTPQRFLKIKERLNNEGIEPVRFRAIDGFEIFLTDKKTGEVIAGKETMKNIGSYTWNKRPVLYHVSYNGKHKEAEFDLLVKYRKFSAGEIGVTFSHRAIWIDIVKHHYKRAIVFEDDAIPLKNFKKDLKNLLENNPTDSDITMISVGRLKDKLFNYPCIDNIFRDFDHVPNNNFVAKIQPTNRVYGSFAYIVGESGAKKLLEESNPILYPIDDIIFQQNGKKHKINAYVSKKKICTVDFSDSEIKKMGRPF
jgi:GR25 family glycosyltransferase involved in LPS biosynthesis